MDRLVDDKVDAKLIAVHALRLAIAGPRVIPVAFMYIDTAPQNNAIVKKGSRYIVPLSQLPRLVERMFRKTPYHAPARRLKVLKVRALSRASIQHETEFTGGRADVLGS